MKSIYSIQFKTAIMALVIVILLGCNLTDQSSKQQITVFKYDKTAIPNAKPWTHENFKNNPDNFQFAIIGDRTGGANVQGTFRLAMDQINLLQPEFVINVGDIIEGYTEDRGELSEMWEETDVYVGNLQMPFFRTRGNHDVSNALARELWAERYGPNYYYFVYGNVLFMVLDSEDNPRPEPPPDMKEKIKLYNRLQTEDPKAAQEMLAEFMKDEAVVASLGKPVEFPEKQMSWITKTLAENADVRWTFLFMHEPCWENPSESFKEIEKMLQDRDYTCFAGHLHYYDYDNINGREYITMGPAGASWHHNGPGNVDHIMWVTMTDTGPQMGNIALKGLFNRMGLDTTLFGAYDRKGVAQ